MCCLTCIKNCKKKYPCFCYLMCMCCKEIKCCPNDRVFIKFCNLCELTNWCFGIIQIFFTLGLYYFDIASDIMVLVDLNKTNSEYFNLCLVILLLPTFYALTKYETTKKCIDKFSWNGCCNKCFCNIPKILFCLLSHFLFNVFQFNVICSSFSAVEKAVGFDTKGNQLEYVDIRMTESLLESSPQSLFQLFLVLKNVSKYTYNQSVIYYLSISLSIFSLVFSLVSYEVTYYNKKRIKYIAENYLSSEPSQYGYKNVHWDGPIEIFELRNVSRKKCEEIAFKSIPTDEGEKQIFDIRYKHLEKHTPYIILLFFYRLTEVLSRIGLLAVIGNIYDGYLIMIFLLSDFFILTIANLYTTILIPINCKALSNAIVLFYIKSGKKKDVSCSYKCKKWLNISKSLFFTLNGIISIITFLILQLKNLTVFSNYFLFYIFNETYKFLEKDNLFSYWKMWRQIKINKNVKDTRQKVFKMEFKNHFISRYINNLCLSILIIYNLITNTYSQSIFLISISSMICFILNIVFLGLIILFTRNYIKYSFMFKPIMCGKCCEKAELDNKIIERKNEEKKLELEDVYGNKKDETNEKHPEDVII